jgi:threonine dehydrogenase-like Zn-dependent dehydrogenase
MGQEAAGTVVTVGSNVSGISEGGRVTFDSTVYCGACPNCLRGDVNLCDRRELLGVSCGDYRRAGAFAECVLVPARIVHRLPDNFDLDAAVVFLASEAGCYITGHTLLIDGGISTGAMRALPKTHSTFTQRPIDGFSPPSLPRSPGAA